MRTFFCLFAPVIIAISNAPLRAQDDTARLREGRLYAESLASDTTGKNLRMHSFSYDNPRLTPSQGRTTSFTFRTDSLGRVQIIGTEQAKGQHIWQATYYLRDDSLLYATEEDILNLKSGEDAGRILWSAAYAFRGGRMVGLSSNGHGVSETDDWHPEVDVPADFKRARARVAAHVRRRRPLR